MTDVSGLEEEQNRRLKLEEQLKAAEDALARCQSQLSEWHKRALDSIPPEEIVDTVLREQISSLTYILAKIQSRAMELEAELAKTKKELEEAKSIFKPPKTEEKKEEKKPPIADENTLGQRISASEILTEEELAEFLGMEDVHQELRKKQSKTIKDLIDLILRLQRVKVVDASLLLDIDKGLMNVWVDKLRNKKLVLVDGRDPILICTDSLINLQKRMK